MAQDYYGTLGVTREASKEDIKKAYRKMAHKYHPDKSNGDEERFKEVNEAYQVLSNEQKRAQYDQFGQTFDGAGPTGAPGGNPFGGAGFNVDFEDLGGFADVFETFFGGQGRQQTRVKRGADVGMDIVIEFREAAQEIVRTVRHRIYQACDTCHGNGAQPGTPIETCQTCKGSGATTTTRQTMFGAFSQRSACEDCNGEGKRAKNPCTTCSGEGRVMGDREIEIRIPAGIANGQQVRIPGKGEASAHGGMSGDLYVTVHVKPDATLTRSGNTVRSTAKVSFAQAALGTTLKVDTLRGKKEIRIPAGTQPGDEIKLSGGGFPDVQSGRAADHIVTATVVVPKSLSRKQKKLLEDFEASSKKGFFS